MKNKKDYAKLKPPIFLRKEILRQAMIESGVISAENNELFECFWEKYKDILIEKEKAFIIFD